MQLSTTFALNISDKVKKILGRGVYLYDERGTLLNGGAPKVDFESLEAIKENREITKFREGRYFSWLPLHYDGKLIGVVSIQDKKEEKSKELSSLAAGLAEVLLYEEFLVKNIHIANDLRTDFIKEILTGSKIKTTEEAIEQGDIVGVNLRFKHTVMIFEIKNLYQDYLASQKNVRFEAARIRFQKYLKEIEDYIMEACKSDIQDCIVYVGENKFVILKDINGEGINTLNSQKAIRDAGKHIYTFLNKKFPEKVSLGLGQFYPGLSGLRKSYEDASIALKLGEKVMGPGNIYHILDVAMFVGLLGSISASRKNELAFQVLENLFEDKDLLKTTKAFLDSGMNLTDAAKKLHLHRNTLIYRLGKVKNLIGLDPTHFHDALQIKLGLTVSEENKVPMGIN